MGLLPEFFLLLGIDIFSAMSLLTALLDREFPQSVQWLFQGAAAMGLGQLLISQGFITNGVFTRDPTDPTRFWISIIYLGAALSNVLGLNIYIGAIRRKTALATTFGGTVTVPSLMTSAFFISSFTSTNGDVSITPTTLGILVVSALISGLSILGFLRQAIRHIGGLASEKVPRIVTKAPTLTRQATASPTGPVLPPPGAPSSVLPFRLPARKREEWEEAPRKEEGGGEN